MHEYIRSTKLSDTDFSNHPYKSIICTNCGHHKKVHMMCKDPTCPQCRRKLNARLLHRVQDRIQNAGEIRFLTLTSLSVQYLDVDKVRWLRKQWHKFWKLMQKRQYMIGGLYAIECTHSEEHGWHLHIHIVYEGKYIPQAFISNQWRKFTGAFIVHITKPQTYKNTFFYILSYLSKQQKMEPKYQAVLKKVFDSIRTIQTFGEWYFKTDKQKTKVDTPCPQCGRTDCWKSARTLEYEAYHAMKGPPQNDSLCLVRTWDRDEFIKQHESRRNEFIKQHSSSERRVA